MADGTLRLIHHSNLQRIYGLDRGHRRAGAHSRPELDWRLDVYGDGPWRGADRGGDRGAAAPPTA